MPAARIGASPSAPYAEARAIERQAVRSGGERTESGTAEAELDRRFADPPADTRILRIIHGWPDDPAAQDALIRTLKSQGFGGVVCNVSFDRYLQSEAHWTAFVRAVREAKRAGMAMWIYDEHGYPSGSAAGLTVLGHPEFEAQGLLTAHCETEGAKVDLLAPPGRIVRAAAFPMTDGVARIDRGIELAGSIEHGRLTWTPPPGRWWVMICAEAALWEATHVEGATFGDHSHYPNLLMAAATDRFLRLTHVAYASRLGHDLGRLFIATFTDEPSLLSIFERRMPYCPLPWSPELPAEFRRRRGYAIEPLLPALLVDCGGSGGRVRYDFWRTVGELVSESYFGRIADWDRRHGLLSGGHLDAETGVLPHVPLYGDYYACMRRQTLPGIDCLSSLPPRVPWMTARVACGAAEVCGRRIRMCETSDAVERYRPPGDPTPPVAVTPTQIRGTVNRLFANGINEINSYYTFTGLTSQELNEINAYVGRCCTLLRGGCQASDVALLYPIESLWPRFRPSDWWVVPTPEIARIETAYRAAIGSLFAARREFTVIDSKAILESKVEGGALAHGGLRWRVVVLPGADTLPAAAWRRLERFWRAGGTIVALGALPANSDREFPCRGVLALAGRIFESGGQSPSVRRTPGAGTGVFIPFGAESKLPTAIDAALPPDVVLTDPEARVRIAHRRIDGREVYFMMNDGPEAWEGGVTFSCGSGGEAWNPLTGRRTAVPANAMRASMEPYGALIVRLRPTAAR
jgi:hypothetical protein